MNVQNYDEQIDGDDDEQCERELVYDYGVGIYVVFDGVVFEVLCDD